MWNLDSRRAAETLAEFSDTACFVPCRHCAELLQEDDRFCRYCGVDQLAALASPVQPALKAQEPVDFADTIQPDEHPAIVRGATMLAANEAGNSGTGPDPNFGASGRTGLPDGPAARPRSTRVLATILAIAGASLLVLVALPVAPNGALDKVSAAVAVPLPIQSASARVTTNPGEPIQRSTPSQVQGPQPADVRPRDPTREPASDVITALGLSQPAPVASPADVASPPATIQGASPGPQTASPGNSACSEALAALAMCPAP